VRRRILATIVAVVTLAVAGFAVPLAIAVSNTYWNDARLSLQREAAAATIEIPSEFPAVVDPSELPVPEDGTNLGLYGVDGTLLAGRGPTTADPLVDQALTGTAADGRYLGEVVAAVPVSRDEVIIGAIRAAEPAFDIEARIWRARATMAALAVLVVAVASAVAARQARRLALPLEHLADAAQRLGDGDFTVRNAPSGFEEIDAAGDALDRTADRLGRLITRERAFSADVSHQLRTPLTSLRLDLENGIATPGVDKAEAIERALASVDGLESTIEDLISLARDTSAHPGPLDIATLLAEIDGTWRRPLAAQQRNLRVVGSDTDVVPLISTAAVRQILSVLLANSVEHGAGDVLVVVTACGDWLRIEVSDGGPGIHGDPEEAFRRRADRTKERGIGLALARSLAEAEGGSLVYLGTPTPRFVLTFGHAVPAPPEVGVST